MERPAKAIRIALITLTAIGVSALFLSTAVTSLFVVKAALDPVAESALVLEHAPHFALTGPSGETVRSEDLKGSRFILAFWASWDPVSEATISELNSIFDAGVVVIGVNLMEDRAKVLAAIQRYFIRFPVALDPDGSVGRLYSVHRTPSIFVIDSDGRVSYRGDALPEESAGLADWLNSGTWNSGTETESSGIQTQ